MINGTKVADLQRDIVLAFARSISETWGYLLVNFEREIIDGEPTEDCLALIFSQEGVGWRRNSIKPPYESYDLFIQLCNEMSNNNSDTWGSCTLEVDSSGKYRFLFHYNSPKRLNGVFNDESLFNNYTPHLF